MKFLYSFQNETLDNLKLAQKEIPPPYVPTFDCDGNDLTSNFDPQFTREPADLTPDDP